jgi:hypothetical protein
MRRCTVERGIYSGRIRQPAGGGRDGFCNLSSNVGKLVQGRFQLSELTSLSKKYRGSYVVQLIEI